MLKQCERGILLRMMNSDALRVIQAAPSRRDSHEIAALGVPYLAHLIDDLEEKQAKHGERIGRWYQRDLLRKGRFVVRSVWDNEPVQATQSVLLEDKTIAYGFGPALNFWLFAGSFGEGAPIQGIYLPQRAILVNLGHEAWGVTETHVRKAMTIFNSLPLDMDRISGPTPSLVTGDASFAHHIWNQLGALDRLIADEPEFALERTNVVVMQEPLGPLAELFDDCPNWKIRYVHSSRVQQLNCRDTLFVQLAGMLVTEGAKARVFKYVERAVDLPEAVVRRNPAGRFWLSIRTRNRTITNQVQFLTELANSLIEEYPGCDIVLDGHSLSEDDYRLVELGDSSNHAIAAADADVAAKVIKRLVQRDSKIYQTAGRPLSEALALARTCDFYVCHHGTVQHKIGWFTWVPGVAHANTRVTRSKPALSVAAQTEGSPPPSYLPVELIEDEASNARSALADALKHENYTIVSVDEACRFVLSEIKATTALRV
ncbi:hypothetical protein VAPA_1c08220 [Variovorax paradoxus B4]|uniref:Uncharacterized protein n=1 Tax=Variovorax paradoxus B4 TaxID=1246301 RepID=T1X4U7_VARPD|nr:hypothetical protein [Variovorax paradoxus]AGU47942.1 hypothetical protein VAPA_1c08220 [Variovorax paradoxus B4]